MPTWIFAQTYQFEKNLKEKEKRWNKIEMFDEDEDLPSTAAIPPHLRRGRHLRRAGGRCRPKFSKSNAAANSAAVE